MKIYLDTSVLSALFDGRNPERQELTKDIVNMVNTINNFQLGPNVPTLFRLSPFTDNPKVCNYLCKRDLDSLDTSILSHLFPRGAA